MLSWIIAGLVVLALAVLQRKHQRKLKARYTSPGGVEGRAAAQRGRDEGRWLGDL